MWVLAQAASDATTVALLALAGTGLTVVGTVIAAWLSRRRESARHNSGDAVVREMFGLARDLDRLSDRVENHDRRLERLEDRVRTQRERHIR